MFDSPLEWCRVYRIWVAVDGSRASCALEHGCTTSRCPLEHLFTQKPPHARDVARAAKPGRVVFEESDA